MTYETDRWPFVPAKYFHSAEDRVVDLIVIHTAEVLPSSHGAEDVAQYFAIMPDDRKASAHVVVDSDSIVQCVHDKDVAYGAPGANRNGIHIEIAGKLNSSADDWNGPVALAELTRAADVVAQYCLKYDIPVVHLTDAQLQAGNRGIVGHVQVSNVFKKSDHQDPGENFPWAAFMLWVKGAYEKRRPAQ